MPSPKGCGNCGWNGGLREDNRGFVFTCQCHHFLLAGYRHRPTLFSICPGDAFVGLSLIDQQVGSNVVTHTDVCDIDRDNLKCCL